MSASLVALLCIALTGSSAACSTAVAGRGATTTGAVLTSHSNDGDGDVAGNLIRVPAATHLPAGALRATRGGGVPQVEHTFAYFTKPGGYASLNSEQVGLSESTCSGVFDAVVSSGKLSIVDLSQLAMERARTALEAVTLLGNLSETAGYNDNAE